MTSPWILHHEDCLKAMAAMESDSVDAIVTDPPYGLEFMGKDWDHGVPGVPYWQEALRVAKPGAYLLAFGGTRMYHRLAVAIEDAGWEIRDSIGLLGWVYGSGFPKSLDVSKAIDKAAGAERTDVVGVRHRNVKPYDDGNGWNSNNTKGNYEYKAPATDAARQWAGWGTALKPAHEPIILARKPLISTVAANVLKHGTGGINIDACRIGFASEADKASAKPQGAATAKSGALAGGTQNDRDRKEFVAEQSPQGRWPSNVILGCCGNDPHDPDCAVRLLDEQTGVLTTNAGTVRPHNATMGYGGSEGSDAVREIKADSGGASRFFYVAKASRSERTHGGEVVNLHPTVKPVALMRWLCRLVCPPGGTILDPFAGSGTTGLAALEEGFMFVGIEREAEYAEIARKRLEGRKA